MAKKRRRRYKARPNPEPPATPRCGCGAPTEPSRTSPEGMYFKCSAGHELYVMLGDLAGLMGRQWAKEGADVPDQRKDEYYKGRAIAARELRTSMELIERLHAPLDELG